MDRVRLTSFMSEIGEGNTILNLLVFYPQAKRRANFSPRLAELSSSRSDGFRVHAAHVREQLVR